MQDAFPSLLLYFGTVCILPDKYFIHKIRTKKRRGSHRQGRWHPKVDASSSCRGDLSMVMGSAGIQTQVWLRSLRLFHHWTFSHSPHPFNQMEIGTLSYTQRIQHRQLRRLQTEDQEPGTGWCLRHCGLT